MTTSLTARLQAELDEFKNAGVYKRLLYLDGMQSARTRMEGRGDVVILSSNNYVGLCDVPEVIAAGKAALDRFGAGTGSVRFICGTFTIHRELEEVLARWVGTEASLTYVVVLDRQRGARADAAGRAGRGDLGPAEPRVDHRRGAAGQGHHQVPDGGVRALGHGRPQGEAGAVQGLPAQAGDHRRRLLDGGRRREAGRHPGAGAAATARRSRWTTRTPRASWGRRGAARRSTAACWARSTSSRARSARRWAARPAGSRRPRRRCATT